MSVPDPVSISRRFASSATTGSAAQSVDPGCDGRAPADGTSALRMGLDIGSTTIKLVLLSERLPEVPAGAPADSASGSPVSPVLLSTVVTTADVAW